MHRVRECVDQSEAGSLGQPDMTGTKDVLTVEGGDDVMAVVSIRAADEDVDTLKVKLKE